MLPYSINVILGKSLNGINNLLGNFITGMKDKVEKVGIGNIIPEEGVNPKQLIDILNMFNK